MTDTVTEKKIRISDADLVQKCCLALDNKKAEDIKILFLGQKSTVADYFVIATGTSNPHLRALRIALEKELDVNKVAILGMDMSTNSGWAVVDSGNIIFHLFTKRMREMYSLESLWKDAEDIVVEATKPVPVVAKPAAAKKKPATKKPAAKKTVTKKEAVTAKAPAKKSATKVVKAAPKKLAQAAAVKPAKTAVAKSTKKAAENPALAAKPASKAAVKKTAVKTAKPAKTEKVVKVKTVAKPAAKAEKTVKTKAPAKSAAKKKTK